MAKERPVETNLTSGSRAKEHIDRILLGQSSLRKLKPYIGDWEAVLQFYARRMSELYPADSQSATCHLCNAYSAQRFTYTWVANYDTKETLLRNAVLTPVFLLFGHLHFNYKIMEFSTEHWLCRSCARRQFLRQTASEFVTKVSFIGLVLSLFALVFSSAFLIYLLVVPSGHAEVVNTGKLAFGSLAASFLFFFGTSVWSRAAFPKALGGLGKAPFALVRRKQSRSP